MRARLETVWRPGSPRRPIAGRCRGPSTASEIWSATLSGCPSGTDSEINNNDGGSPSLADVVAQASALGDALASGALAAAL